MWNVPEATFVLGTCILHDSTIAMQCACLRECVYMCSSMYLAILCEEIGGAGGMLQIFPLGV